MSLFDDGIDEMRAFALDDGTADALMAGRVAPDDAPPGYEHVAALVRAARGPATAREMAQEQQIVAAMAASVLGPPNVVLSRKRRGKMLGQLVSAKAIAGVVALALGGGVAAAATGSLPGPAQTAVSDAFSHVGVSLPNPDNQNTTALGTNDSSSPSGSPGKAVGPNVTGPAGFGLCTAFAASNGHPSTHSVAFANLEKAATAAGQTVTQFCSGVTQGSKNTTSGDTNQSGKPSSTPAHGSAPVTTPAGPPSSTPAHGQR